MFDKLKDWLTGAHNPSVDVRTLRGLLQETPCPMLIDVRTDFEYRTGRIRCAVHVPMDEVMQRVPDLAEGREGRVFLICQTGNRSTGAQEALNPAGVATINVTGGMRAWEAAGFPIE